MPSLLEKAQQSGMKPAGRPTGSLVQKAQQLGMKPANPPVQPAPDPFRSIKADFAGSLENAQQGMVDSVAAQIQGKQTMPETAVQMAGQGAGYGVSLFGNVISRIGKNIFGMGKEVLGDVLPQGVKDKAKDVIGSAGDAFNKFNRKYPAIGAVEEIAKDNPRAARNIEAGVNLVSIAPVARPVVGVVNSSRAVAGEAANLLEGSAKASIAAERESFARELIRPTLTKTVKEAEVARTTETGTGIFKKSVVNPTPAELKAQEAVMSIPEVSSKNTYQQNFNIVKEANVQEAKVLRSTLKANDFAYSKDTLKAELQRARQRLVENPALVGDAAATADKLIAKAEKLINDKPNTGSSILDARQEFDDFVRSQKGDAAFDPAKENAFSIANREIRQTFNKFLDAEAERMGVQKSVRESLSRQSALYDAMENIAPKAAQEANTAIGRAFQNMARAVGLKNKLVQKIAAVAGIGGLGAAAVFAPAASVVGVGGFLTYQAGKLILKPEVRVGLAKLLRLVEQGSLTDKAVVDSVNAIRAVVNSKDDILSLPAPSYIEAKPYKGGASKLFTQDEINARSR